ncbi:hypothetical protein BD310DRAFT_930912 [Dichomitus squalens]|uniref:Uncharacterized protein n=1 Tax=Dichomitus squalens TaxID=114155 RepID=A0A4Q9PQT1_9APHY|nr:hypothetical protein BD310DRAFT_930912 [Dichomitus squalens]
MASPLGGMMLLLSSNPNSTPIRALTDRGWAEDHLKGANFQGEEERGVPVARTATTQGTALCPYAARVVCWT